MQMRVRALLSFLLLTTSAWGYVPVEMPNGSTLAWEMVDGVKVFRLVAEPVKCELASGFVVNCWGYNGTSPGPLIEAVEGDRVRILVTNHLPEATTIHWHGIITPNNMDGVSGVSQAPIQPGATCTYEFTLKQSGTFMYHPHCDEMTQLAMGMGSFFIIHPQGSSEPPVDRDFAIMLREYAIPPGAATPDPSVMNDFNYFTFNNRIFPGTAPLVVRTGQRVRIRLANLGMDSHPIHLHGSEFTVTRYGGSRVPPAAQYTEVTVNVPVGTTRDLEFVADNPGDWAFHCHKSHHTMNGMGHNIPNMLGVDQKPLLDRLQKLVPGYMPMGENGMEEMFHHHHMPGPKNFPPFGSQGPHGVIDMGGMLTFIKVRDDLTSYEDPGWYGR